MLTVTTVFYGEIQTNQKFVKDSSTEIIVLNQEQKFKSYFHFFILETY